MSLSNDEADEYQAELAGLEREIAQRDAEVERLRGEKSYLEDEVIPALRAEIEQLREEECQQHNRITELMREIERLRVIKCNLVDEGKLLVCKAHAEIERQQAALTYIRDDSTDLDDAKTVARFALELERHSKQLDVAKRIMRERAKALRALADVPK